jgi:Fe2+ or Zn2+ uptake regulation protein
MAETNLSNSENKSIFHIKKRNGKIVQFEQSKISNAIYKALVEKYPVFSRTTIYNTLNTLVQACLVRPVTIRADEQCFDATTDDHGHFLCSSCGNIYDFDVNSNSLSKLCPDGFSQSQGDVFFTGLCPKCKDNQN